MPRARANPHATPPGHAGPRAPHGSARSAHKPRLGVRDARPRACIYPGQIAPRCGSSHARSFRGPCELRWPHCRGQAGQAAARCIPETDPCSFRNRGAVLPSCTHPRGEAAAARLSSRQQLPQPCGCARRWPGPATPLVAARSDIHTSSFRGARSARPSQATCTPGRCSLLSWHRSQLPQPRSCAPAPPVCPPPPRPPGNSRTPARIPRSRRPTRHLRAGANEPAAPRACVYLVRARRRRGACAAYAFVAIECGKPEAPQPWVALVASYMPVREVATVDAAVSPL